jgi:hypothetical protein
LADPLPEGTSGFSSPFLLRGGQHVPLQRPAPGQAPNSQQVLLPGGDTPSAICAIGLDGSGHVVRVSLVGDVDALQRADRLPTERDVVRVL